MSLRGATVPALSEKKGLAASRLCPWTSGAMGWVELATASKQKTLAEGNYPPKWFALIEDLVG